VKYRLFLFLMLAMVALGQPPGVIGVGAWNDGRQTWIRWTDPTTGTLTNFRFWLNRSTVGNAGPWIRVQGPILPQSGVRADFRDGANGTVDVNFTMANRISPSRAMATVNGVTLASGSGLAVYTPWGTATGVWYGVETYDITSGLYSSVVVASGSVNEVPGTPAPFLIASSSARGLGITGTGLRLVVGLHGSNGSAGAPALAGAGDQWGEYGDSTMNCQGGGGPRAFTAYKTTTTSSDGVAAGNIIMQPRDTSWDGFWTYNVGTSIGSQSFWYGNDCSAIGTASTPRTFTLTTENWLNHLIPWVTTHYNADPEKVIIYGRSMGGMGTMGYAFRHHPELFAAVFPSDGDPAQNWYIALAPLQGNATQFANSSTPTLGDGTPLLTEEDTIAYVNSYTGDSLPPMNIAIAMNDTTINSNYWQHFVALLDALKAKHLAYSAAWNPGIHLQGPVATLLGYYQNSFTRNVSHPAFANSSLDSTYSATKSSTSCWNATPATTPVCGVNLGFVWSGVTETASTWAATISNSLNSAGMTADITPRRAQLFHLTSGNRVNWTATGGQSGSAVADSSGVVTALNVSIPASSAITLTFTTVTANGLYPLPSAIRGE